MPHQAKNPSGFTLIELLVVISIIALLLGILVPVLGVAKKSANILKEGVDLRNIHAALVTYGTSNKDWFPGLTAKGQYAGYRPASSAGVAFIGKYYAAATNAMISSRGVYGHESVGQTVAYAQAVLMDEGGSTPAQWISPGETSATGGNIPVLHSSRTVFAAAPTKGTAAAVTNQTLTSTTGMVSQFNNSHALLAYGAYVGASGSRTSDMNMKSEWRSNQNQKAVVLGSRMVGTTNSAFETSAALSFSSLWTTYGSGAYKGAVVRGDTSTTTEAFKRADPASSFGTLKYGNVTGTPATATAGRVGPFAHVGVTTVNGGGTTTVGGMFLGTTVTAGAFTLGQIAAPLN